MPPLIETEEGASSGSGSDSTGETAGTQADFGIDSTGSPTITFHSSDGRTWTLTGETILVWVSLLQTILLVYSIMEVRS